MSRSRHHSQSPLVIGRKDRTNDRDGRQSRVDAQTERHNTEQGLHELCMQLQRPVTRSFGFSSPSRISRRRARDVIRQLHMYTRLLCPLSCCLSSRSSPLIRLRSTDRTITHMTDSIRWDYLSCDDARWLSDSFQQCTYHAPMFVHSLRDGFVECARLDSTRSTRLHHRMHRCCAVS